MPDEEIESCGRRAGPWNTAEEKRKFAGHVSSGEGQDEEEDAEGCRREEHSATARALHKESAAKGSVRGDVLSARRARTAPRRSQRLLAGAANRTRPAGCPPGRGTEHRAEQSPAREQPEDKACARDHQIAHATDAIGGPGVAAKSAQSHGQRRDQRHVGDNLPRLQDEER